MNLQWFLSSSVRHAMDVCKHYRKLFESQRDILSPQGVEGMETALDETKSVIDSNPSRETLSKQLETLETAATKWLKPYPSPGWRENVEVFLVAIAVAMAIRTFFLQPFKIPTGSMQPTLYGVTVKNYREDPTIEVPGILGRFTQMCLYGVYYTYQVAEDDGKIIDVQTGKTAAFINQATIRVQYDHLGEKSYTFRMTLDERFGEKAGVYPGMTFSKGEPILKMREVTGDHLFVDRITYNFRPPHRGDIIVFETKNIEGLQPGQFYIKRLVGLGGEKLNIGDDRHVRIDGKRLDASTPHFENVYSFTNLVAQDSVYSGHSFTPEPYYFSKADQEFPIPNKFYFAMGDNTKNSSDSRYWGPLPQKNVIGKPCFIYWPLSPRFGWGYR